MRGPTQEGCEALDSDSGRLGTPTLLASAETPLYGSLPQPTSLLALLCPSKAPYALEACTFGLCLLLGKL